MRILFDQNVPRNLVQHLPKHHVTRSAQLGWGALKNGALLMAAEQGGFEALVTADQNLSYQQNMSGRQIGVVVLSTNNWPIIKGHLGPVIQAVDEAAPSSFKQVDCGIFVKTSRRK